MGLIAAEAFKGEKSWSRTASPLQSNLSDPNAVPEEEPATAVEEACRRSAISTCFLITLERGVGAPHRTDMVPVEGLVGSVVRACEGWALCEALSVSATALRQEQSLAIPCSVSLQQQARGAARHTCPAPDHRVKPHSEGSGCCVPPATRQSPALLVCMSHTFQQIQLESRAACLKVLRPAAGRTPRTSATSTACCSGARCRRTRRNPLNVAGRTMMAIFIGILGGLVLHEGRLR